MVSKKFIISPNLGFETVGWILLISIIEAEVSKNYNALVKLLKSPVNFP
jgi:hypothetical protein